MIGPLLIVNLSKLFFNSQ